MNYFKYLTPSFQPGLLESSDQGWEETKKLEKPAPKHTLKTITPKLGSLVHINSFVVKPYTFHHKTTDH